MTRMQLEWVNAKTNRLAQEETARSNLARETETNRSNLANEAETKRSNQAREHENYRSNTAREYENYRHNVQTENETSRHNIADETETARSHAAVEKETRRHQRAQDSYNRNVAEANAALAWARAKEQGQATDALTPGMREFRESTTNYNLMAQANLAAEQAALANANATASQFSSASKMLDSFIKGADVLVHLGTSKPSSGTGSSTGSTPKKNKK